MTHPDGPLDPSDNSYGSSPRPSEGKPAPGRDLIAARFASLRWSTAIVLAGFMLNAGIVVLLVALLSDSILASLVTVAIMASVILLSAAYYDVVTLRFTGARPLLASEYPWLRPMVADLSAQVGIDEPAVLIWDDEGMNAFTTGMGRRVKVAFSTGLLQELSEDEVRAVAAHEVGHAKNNDIAVGIWTAAVSVWVVAVSWVVSLVVTFIFEFSKQLPRALSDIGPLGGFVGVLLAAMGFTLAAFLWAITALWVFISRVVQMTVSRAREFLADTTAAAVTGEPEALARALAKISERAQLSKGASVASAFCIASPFADGGWWSQLLSTHPPTERRIKELQRLSGTEVSPPSDDWEGVGKGRRGSTCRKPGGACGARVDHSFSHQLWRR